MTRFLSIPYTFVMMNCAAVMGLLCFLRGRRDVWRSCHTER
jgi:hypothetical protein